MAQVLCPGCDKPVSVKGILRHIRTTQNERCLSTRRTLHAPGPVHSTASSLASIPAAPSFLSPDNFSEFGANQWPQVEGDFSMRTQEGKLTATRVSGQTSMLIICMF